MVTIRKMEASEAKTVQKIGMKAFHGLEGIFIGKPKEAVVAVSDGKIVGGIILKYICCGSVKIGYLDAGFVDPAYHGQGIGGVLYRGAIEALWEQGCTAVSAAVKDDNCASWSLLLKNGLERVTLLEAVRRLGWKSLLFLYFTTPFFISNGMELYLAVKEKTVAPKSGGSAINAVLYLLANLLLITGTFLGDSKDIPLFLCAYAVFLLCNILFGFAGALLGKGVWRFRLNNGGAVITALIGLLGAPYPLIGNWYPPQYENTRQFRKKMGTAALCEWILMLLLTIGAYMIPVSSGFWHLLASFGSVALIYRILAVYPFESFGGGRVFRWNKGVFAVMAAISACVLVFL